MQRSRNVPIGVLAAALAVVTAIAAPAARAQNVPTVASALDTGAIVPAMVARGRAVFHGAGTCLVCHGSALEGTAIAPALRGHVWKRAIGGTYPEIHRVITSGVAGTAMVARPGGIKDAEALAVAAYVWSVSHGKAKP